MSRQEIDAGDAQERLRDALATELYGLAARYDVVVTEGHGHVDGAAAPVETFHVAPADDGACALDLHVDTGWEVYAAFAEDGWVEVFTGPTWTDLGLPGVRDLLEAVAAGRVRRVVWTDKRAGILRGSEVLLQEKVGRRWSQCGGGLPWLARRRCDRTDHQYAPWPVRGS